MSWEAIGIIAALATGLGAFGINLWKALRTRRADQHVERADLVRANAEAKLAAMEAAERALAIYGSTISDLKTRITHQEGRVRELEALVKVQEARINELEHENAVLRGI